LGAQSNKSQGKRTCRDRGGCTTTREVNSIPKIGLPLITALEKPGERNDQKTEKVAVASKETSREKKVREIRTLERGTFLLNYDGLKALIEPRRSTKPDEPPEKSSELPSKRCRRGGFLQPLGLLGSLGRRKVLKKKKMGRNGILEGACERVAEGRRSGSVNKCAPQKNGGLNVSPRTGLRGRLGLIFFSPRPRVAYEEKPRNERKRKYPCRYRNLGPDGWSFGAGLSGETSLEEIANRRKYAVTN